MCVVCVCVCVCAYLLVHSKRGIRYRTGQVLLTTLRPCLLLHGLLLVSRSLQVCVCTRICHTAIEAHQASHAVIANTTHHRHSIPRPSTFTDSVRCTKKQVGKYSCQGNVGLCSIHCALMLRSLRMVSHRYCSDLTVRGGEGGKRGGRAGATRNGPGHIRWKWKLHVAETRQ